MKAHFWLPKLTCPIKIKHLILTWGFLFIHCKLPFAYWSLPFPLYSKPVLGPSVTFMPSSLPLFFFPFPSSSIFCLCILFPALCLSWAHKSPLCRECDCGMSCAYFEFPPDIMEAFFQMRSPPLKWQQLVSSWHKTSQPKGFTYTCRVLLCLLRWRSDHSRMFGHLFIYHLQLRTYMERKHSCLVLSYHSLHF